MRFKIFGFKGELSTGSGQKKKKTKEDRDDEVVGIGFRAYSEFGASTSKFQKSSQANGAKTIQQNGTTAAKPNTQLGAKSNAPQQKEPPPKGAKSNAPQQKEPPPKGSAQPNNVNQTAEKKPPKETVSILKKTAPKPPKRSTPSADENLEKSTLISMTENKVDEGAGRSNKNDDHQPIYDEVRPLEKSSTSVVTTVETHAKPDDGEIKSTDDGKKFMVLGGFDDEPDDSSEDEFGGKKSKGATKNTQAEQKPTKNAQNSSDYGYSNQAASIFFRSDSPEPEQRIRNFSIKKGGYNSDEDDNTSQTSA